MPPPSSRRFPAPWAVRAHEESFAVHDATGFTILYIYFTAHQLIGTGPDRLNRDQARRIALNIAKLPELLRRDR